MATALKEAFPIAFEHPQDRSKPRKPPRPCPSDFETTFVKLGRVDCEPHYRVSRRYVDRWLDQVGKQKLIDKRAAYVAQQRADGLWLTRSSRLVEHHQIKRTSVRESIRDRRKVSDTVARHAAQFLRIKRNAGLIVSPTGEPGTWWVGSRRLSAAQMLDLARSRGFDDAAVAPGGSASA